MNKFFQSLMRTAAGGGPGSEGPLSPSVGADDASVGDVAWLNPGNITSSDDSYATATGQNNVLTHYLSASGFGFAIPSGATVDGIKVEIEMKRTGNLSAVARVSIVKGGVVGTQNRATDAGAVIPGAEAYKTYGSASQLWNETWSAANINASNFGVVFQAELDFGEEGTPTPVLVDHFRVTVYYTT